MFSATVLENSFTLLPISGNMLKLCRYKRQHTCTSQHAITLLDYCGGSTLRYGTSQWPEK